MSAGEVAFRFVEGERARHTEVGDELAVVVEVEEEVLTSSPNRSDRGTDRFERRGELLAGVSVTRHDVALEESGFELASYGLNLG